MVKPTTKQNSIQLNDSIVITCFLGVLLFSAAQPYGQSRSLLVLSKIIIHILTYISLRILHARKLK